MTIRLPLAAIVLLLAVDASRAQEIPKNLKADADKAFADGATYFLWLGQKEPVKGEQTAFSGSARILVNYALSPKAKPAEFHIKSEIMLIEAGGAEVQRTVGSKSPGVNKAMQRLGKEQGVIIVPGNKLRDSEIVRLFVISIRDEPISNVLEVEVKFPKKK
jgi:hypothetical protein